MSDDNVVFLKFRNEKLDNDNISIVSCSSCRNKTFTLIHEDSEEKFPAMRCAACGLLIGQIGWIDDGVQ